MSSVDLASQASIESKLSDIDELYIRVLGETVENIPDELYIPPEAFSILLEQFEGPLDFLLYLVQKNGFDLACIDIAPIAEQYIEYMHKMKSLDIELTADYMLMASLLADIKSRLLLPKPETLNIEQDPKKQLIRRLEQYLQIKQAAQRLSELNILERDVFDADVSSGERPIHVSGYSANLLQDALGCLLYRPEPHVHRVKHEAVQLEERMAFICEKVAKGGQYQLQDLLRPEQGRVGVVVTFMAILELVKQQEIAIVHDGQQQALTVQSRYYM
ncbi:MULTISPECIES: segregation and condensation protein A [unclassified Acinetobacter]|uniref:segregation and condensation protein A n=1 Tax=unclassified Acinetobacter TaxID=196816 RepID=UPI0035B70585